VPEAPKQLEGGLLQVTPAHGPEQWLIERGPQQLAPRLFFGRWRGQHGRREQARQQQIARRRPRLDLGEDRPQAGQLRVPVRQRVLVLRELIARQRHQDDDAGAAKLVEARGEIDRRHEQRFLDERRQFVLGDERELDLDARREEPLREPIGIGPKVRAALMAMIPAPLTGLPSSATTVPLTATPRGRVIATGFWPKPCRTRPTIRRPSLGSLDACNTKARA